MTCCFSDVHYAKIFTMFPHFYLPVDLLSHQNIFHPGEKRENADCNALNHIFKRIYSGTRDQGRKYIYFYVFMLLKCFFLKAPPFKMFVSLLTSDRLKREPDWAFWLTVHCIDSAQLSYFPFHFRQGCQSRLLKTALRKFNMFTICCWCMTNNANEWPLTGSPFSPFWSFSPPSTSRIIWRKKITMDNAWLHYINNYKSTEWHSDYHVGYIMLFKQHIWQKISSKCIAKANLGLM